MSITSFAATPSGVPAFTAARIMSPVEMYGMPKRRQMYAACVPFPAPGAPTRISFIVYLVVLFLGPPIRAPFSPDGAG